MPANIQEEKGPCFSRGKSPAVMYSQENGVNEEKSGAQLRQRGRLGVEYRTQSKKPHSREGNTQ